MALRCCGVPGRDIQVQVRDEERFFYVRVQTGRPASFSVDSLYPYPYSVPYPEMFRASHRLRFAKNGLPGSLWTPCTDDSWWQLFVSIARLSIYEYEYPSVSLSGHAIGTDSGWQNASQEHSST